MKTYSLVLLDIDGTLLNERLEISPNTKKLLGRLEKRGIPVVLCSSRGPSGVEMVERLAGIQDIIVCYGGSLILDRSRAILQDSGVGKETALRFKQYTTAEFPDITVSAYMYDVWLADRTDDPNIRMLAQRNETEAVAGSLETALQAVPHVHKLLCVGDPQRIRQLQIQGRERFPDLRLERSGSEFLEAFALDASKESAMKKLCALLGLEPDQAVAMGDYYVDMEMLRQAGLGIAMGNAPDEVKEAADRVTTSNEADGVYLGLKSLRFQPPAPRKGEDIHGESEL